MRKSISVGFAGTTVLLAGTLVMASLSERRYPDSLAVPLESIDRQILGWTAVTDQQLPPRVLQELNPTSYLSRSYAKDNSQLGLFIAYYARQRAGESMHSPKHCLPGAGWEIWKHDSAQVPFNGQPATINKYSINNAGQRMLMFYWYQSKDRIVASEYVGKILLARDSLMTGYTGGSIVRLMLSDTPEASQRGLDFAAALIPHVQRCIGR